MSRESKYRAWDKSNKIMRDVSSIQFDKQRAYCKLIELEDLGIGLEFDFDDIDLIQYTGMKDNHGIEIYDGSLLAKEGHPNYYVTFELGKYVVVSTNKVQALNWKHWDLNEILALGYTSIGDIYANPELLKEKDMGVRKKPDIFEQSLELEE